MAHIPAAADTTEPLVRYQSCLPSDTERLARLEQAAEAYRDAGYTVVAQTASSLTLVKAPHFSLMLFIVLLVVFWPAAICYSYKRSKPRTACLRLAANGEVVAEGEQLQYALHRPANLAEDVAEPAMQEAVVGGRQVLKLVSGAVVALVIFIVVLAVMHTPPAASGTPAPSQLAPIAPPEAPAQTVPAPHTPARASARRQRAATPPSRVASPTASAAPHADHQP